VERPARTAAERTGAEGAHRSPEVDAGMPIRCGCVVSWRSCAEPTPDLPSNGTALVTS
jgi:hypothetical protein